MEPGLPGLGRLESFNSRSQSIQTLQGKLLAKDHLIKVMADQLRELSQGKVWTRTKALETAVAIDPIRTYDWDRNTLIQYLAGEEPQNFAAAMKGDEDNSNPINVKVVSKLDEDSLLIEWDLPPSEDVVGHQIFINGMFKYWVHSSKQNKALLHPLDLKSSVEIAVNSINTRGKVVLRSKILYMPQ